MQVLRQVHRDRSLRVWEVRDGMLQEDARERLSEVHRELRGVLRRELRTVLRRQVPEENDGQRQGLLPGRRVLINGREVLREVQGVAPRAHV